MAASPTPRRAYKGTDAEMATTLLAILQSAADHQPELAKRRARYTPKFLSDLRAELDTAISQDLGLDPHALVQGLTTDLVAQQAAVRRLISALNRDLTDGAADAGLTARLPQLRTTLGLRDHLAGVQRGNQQSTSEFLAQFAQATDDQALYDELTDTFDVSGPEVLDKLRALRTFIHLDAGQEAAKGSARVVTAEALTRLNDLYARVMRVGSLGRSHFKTLGQPAMADLFSYSAVRRKMTGGQPAAPAPAQPA